MRALLLLCLAAFAVAELPSDIVEVPATEPLTAGLRAPMQTWAQRFPYLRSLVQDRARFTAPQVQTVTNRGYLYFSQTAALQAVEDVSEANFNSFTNYMLAAMGVPRGKVADSISSSVFQVIRWADNSDWVQYTATFSSNTLETKYVCILGHRNIARKTYDFVVADFRNTFRMAPDLLVVKERRSGLWGLFGRTRTRVIEIPRTITASDIEVLTNFFDMAAFSRFAQMLDIRVPSMSGSAALTPYADPITIIAGINAGLDMWERITNLFRTTITNRLVKEVVRTGFDFYVQRSRVQVVQGISGNNMLNNFMPLVPRMMSISGEVARDVQDAIRIGQWVEQYAFNKNDFLFNTANNQLGNVRFVDVIVQQPTDNMYNLILVNVAQEFRMAPNIHIIERSKSIAGGIYQRTDIIRKKVHRDLTQRDIDMLFAFFHISTFKRISAYMNIRITKPDPQIRIG